MAFPILEVINSALELSNTLIDKAGNIITTNQNMINDTDQRNYGLACECINSYKREISIIEDQLKTVDLENEVIQKYLDRVEFINKSIEEFVMKWSAQENESKKEYGKENKAILVGTLGILTGGLGLIPYGIMKNKKK